LVFTALRTPSVSAMLAGSATQPLSPVAQATERMALALNCMCFGFSPRSSRVNAMRVAPWLLPC